MRVTFQVKALFCAIAVTLAAISAKAAEPPAVIGFQAWKDARVEEARTALERIEKAAPPAPAKKNARAPKLKVDVKQLQQAQLNLEVAQELTVNDYFVLYLSQFKTRESFIEAAKKLTPEDAAELMMAYQKQISTSESSDSVPVTGTAPAQAPKTSAN